MPRDPDKKVIIMPTSRLTCVRAQRRASPIRRFFRRGSIRGRTSGRNTKYQMKYFRGGEQTENSRNQFRAGREGEGGEGIQSFIPSIHSTHLSCDDFVVHHKGVRADEETEHDLVPSMESERKGETEQGLGEETQDGLSEGSSIVLESKIDVIEVSDGAKNGRGGPNHPVRAALQHRMHGRRTPGQAQLTSKNCVDCPAGRDDRGMSRTGTPIRTVRTAPLSGGRRSEHSR